MELRQLTQYAADMSEWWDFVSRYMRQREMTRDQVAERGRFNKSRMTEWSRGASVTPKLARDAALALNAPVLDAFIAAGYLQPEDTQAQVVERPIRSLSDDELLNEVTERMKGMRNALETAAAAGAQTQAGRPEEAALYEAERDWAAGWGDTPVVEEPGMDRDKDGKKAHDL